MLTRKGRRGSTVGTGGESSGMLAGDLPDPHIFASVVTVFLGEPNVVTVAVSLPGDLSVLLIQPQHQAAPWSRCPSGGAVVGTAVAAPGVSTAGGGTVDGELTGRHSGVASPFSRVRPREPHPLQLIAPPGPQDPLLLVGATTSSQNAHTAKAAGRRRSSITGTSPPPTRRAKKQPCGEQVSQQRLELLGRVAGAVE